MGKLPNIFNKTSISTSQTKLVVVSKNDLKQNLLLNFNFVESTIPVKRRKVDNTDNSGPISDFHSFTNDFQSQSS